MADGYRRYLPDKQLFAFLISLTNPSDINNSVAQAELQLTYVLDNNIKAVCRIPHSPALAETTSDENGSPANVFSMHTRIDAHQTLVGWLLFSLDEKVIVGRTIDAHRIIVDDSHGTSTETEPILVREWTDETPKK